MRCEAWKEAYVDACLVKPVRQSQLFEALSRARSKRGLAALAAQVGSQAGNSAESPGGARAGG